MLRAEDFVDGWEALRSIKGSSLIGFADVDTGGRTTEDGGLCGRPGRLLHAEGRHLIRVC